MNWDGCTLALSLSVPAQSWSDTRAAHVHMWGDHGGPAVYWGDGRVSIWSSMEVQHVGEYGDKVSQKLPWLQENLQDFHSAMCVCILDSSLQVAGSRGGYHQSVYSSLTALKDGESNLLQSSLADARWVVDHMTDNQSNESSSHMTHLAGQKWLVPCVRPAWRVHTAITRLWASCCVCWSWRRLALKWTGWDLSVKFVSLEIVCVCMWWLWRM